MLQKYFQEEAPQIQRSLPGRTIHNCQRYQAPLSGKIADLETVTATYEKNGIIRTEILEHYIDPPLDDGVVPTSVTEIRECSRCQSLVHMSNTFSCKYCRKTMCVACTHKTISKNEDEQGICRDCFKKINENTIDKFVNWLWSDS